MMAPSFIGYFKQHFFSYHAIIIFDMADYNQKSEQRSSGDRGKSGSFGRGRPSGDRGKSGSFGRGRPSGDRGSYNSGGRGRPSGGGRSPSSFGRGRPSGGGSFKPSGRDDKPSGDRGSYRFRWTRTDHQEIEVHIRFKTR